MADNRTYKNIDLGDTKLFIIGLVLLAVPFYVIFFKAGPSKVEHSRHLVTGLSQGKGRAFNLVSTSKPAKGAGGGGGGFFSRSASSINPSESSVVNELNDVWRKMSASSKRTGPSFIPNQSADAALILSAENDELLAEGAAALDAQNLDEAEKAFNALKKNAAGNDFKCLHAYGGLMEVYLRRNDKERFRQAFKSFALYAQKLRSVYGDMADSVARAYEMFEQIRKIDPGVLREQLTKTNLALGEHVSYNDFMGALDETQSWYPSDLTDGQALKNPNTSTNQSEGK